MFGFGFCLILNPKLVDGTVTEKYLWLNLTTLLAIYDKDDNLIQRYEYADSRMPIAMTTSDNTKLLPILRSSRYSQSYL